MSTVQQIVERGYAKSSAARPDTMASPNELVDRVGQFLRQVFQVIARENPYIIGATSTPSFDGAGWPRPSDSLSVIKVTATVNTAASPALTVNSEINVVPFDDQLFTEGFATLTEFGQKFIPVGQTMDPSGGTVKIWYCRGPIMPTAMGDSIDPLFPSQFDDLLQYDIAEYLATKDQRSEDVATFSSAKGIVMQQLVDWVTAQTYNIQQRFPMITPPLTNDGGNRAQPARGS